MTFNSFPSFTRSLRFNNQRKRERDRPLLAIDGSLSVSQNWFPLTILRQNCLFTRPPFTTSWPFNFIRITSFNSSITNSYSWPGYRNVSVWQDSLISLQFYRPGVWLRLLNDCAHSLTFIISNKVYTRLYLFFLKNHWWKPDELSNDFEGQTEPRSFSTCCGYWL